MLKFEIETSASAVNITKPINQPVRRFKIKRASWFGTKRLYTGMGDEVAFTVGWLKVSKNWFWGSNSVAVKGNVPDVVLSTQFRFSKVSMHDQARGIDMVWHSENQYVIRDADHEIARIYIYKTYFKYNDGNTYVLTVFDEEFDLTVLFLYVFCFKFAMAFKDDGDDDGSDDGDGDSDGDGGDGDGDGDGD